jgi:hypothetical protein
MPSRDKILLGMFFLCKMKLKHDVVPLIPNSV